LNSRKRRRGIREEVLAKFAKKYRKGSQSFGKKEKRGNTRKKNEKNEQNA
jgi:hypothetical protein